MFCLTQEVIIVFFYQVVSSRFKRNHLLLQRGYPSHDSIGITKHVDHSHPISTNVWHLIVDFLQLREMHHLLVNHSQKYICHNVELSIQSKELIDELMYSSQHVGAAN